MNLEGRYAEKQINQFLRQDMQWKIESSRNRFAGVRWWSGPSMLDSKNIIDFRNIRDGFQKNHHRALSVGGRCYIYQRITKFDAFWDTIWRLVIFFKSFAIEFGTIMFQNLDFRCFI